MICKSPNLVCPCPSLFCGGLSFFVGGGIFFACRPDFCPAPLIFLASPDFFAPSSCNFSFYEAVFTGGLFLFLFFVGGFFFLLPQFFLGFAKNFFSSPFLFFPCRASSDLHQNLYRLFLAQKYK